LFNGAFWKVSYAPKDRELFSLNSRKKEEKHSIWAVRCSSVSVVNWDKIGRSRKDKKIRVQFFLFRSLSSFFEVDEVYGASHVIFASYRQIVLGRKVRSIRCRSCDPLTFKQTGTEPDVLSFKCPFFTARALKR
jgi:hypothetical protein